MMRLPDNSERLQTLPVNCLEGLVHTTGLAGGFDFPVNGFSFIPEVIFLSSFLM